LRHLGTNYELEEVYMKIKVSVILFAACLVAAAPAFANSVNYTFGGPDGTLGTSAVYGSGSLTVTAFGYVCHAATPSSTDTLSDCGASNLYQKDDGDGEYGLGLADEEFHEIGWDDATHDYVMGLDVSNLLNAGFRSLTMTFGSVEGGEAYAVLGYASDPFLSGDPFTLTNTKAWFGNDGDENEVYSSTFDLNSDDQYLVLISPCGASNNPDGPCGSNVTLYSMTASTPEPGSLALLATGLLTLVFILRRRPVAVRS
jgi:PEP-CTERM motif